MYAFSFAVSFLTFRFLRRNPSNLLAFPVMLHMWVFQVRLLKIVTPKYLAFLTSSRICPFEEYLFSIGVLGLVMDMELHFPGWNSIPHVSSYSSRWCRSCCNMPVLLCWYGPIQNTVICKKSSFWNNWLWKVIYKDEEEQWAKHRSLWDPLTTIAGLRFLHLTIAVDFYYLEMILPISRYCL